MHGGPGPSRDPDPLSSERRTQSSRGMGRIVFVSVVFAMIATASAISIDNDIIDEPDIECLDDSIRIHVKTRKLFAGRIYAKGRADLPECYKDDFPSERTKKPRFDLKFGVCGMKSLRSVDPRGMYYGITIVVSFHPLFITKVDQAFHVKCFFEEANRGLTAELGVSMIPTTEVEARHGIPGCSYSIHRSSIDDLDAGRPAGPPIQFARVGDRVLHQWHCNDKMYGVLVKSCYVTDGFGKRAEVIDDNGCPVDPILITGIRYSSDLQRGYAESQVFKFADKPGVWFFCQIQMCMKGQNMCNNVTPPACASTAPPPIEGANKSIDYQQEEDVDYRSGSSKTTKKNSSKGRKNGKKTTVRPIGSEYEDEETPAADDDYEAGTNKIRDPKDKFSSNPYGRAAPEGAAFDESSITDSPFSPTVFGPGIATDDFGLPARVTTATETVTQEFETEDDLQVKESPTPPPSKPIATEDPLIDENQHATKLPSSGSSDYNDYSEVTIPPNLTDLLANLPDDLSADSLQKMLRDSVDDRRALLMSMDRVKNQLKLADRKRVTPPSRLRMGRTPSSNGRGALRRGDKIGSMTVDWRNARKRDDPLPMDDRDDNGVPMIAGQLLIYDLDEESPAEAAEKKREEKTILSSDTDSAPECAISRSGLLVLSGSLSAVAAALFVITLSLYIKLSRVGSSPKKAPLPPPPDHLLSFVGPSTAPPPTVSRTTSRQY
ncbi:hypothetical protein PENTCL1PPCAC_22996, partial [Pristionchus entomophagus]